MWSVFLVFLSYLDRNVVKAEFLKYTNDAAKENKDKFFTLNSTLCGKMSVLGENYLYQVSDGVEEVRSVLNPAGDVVGCSVIVDKMQVKSFVDVCRLGMKDRQIEHALERRLAHFEEAKVICQEFTSVALTVSNGKRLGNENDKNLKRSKRGFTYPGTLWCGAGNMAGHYDHLGEFAETDSCCRVHDHCPHVIHAFSSNYGYTNFKWHSICHCDCDTALKDCLRKVNDTASRVVGQAFFNVIGVPCFEFAYEEQCIERHWYGVCKRYEKLPVAVPRQSVPYDFGGIEVIDVLTVAPPKKTVLTKIEESNQAEGTTLPPGSVSQSSRPEEHSLGNIVTAAEDFIKVLASVSTSQSSTNDSTKEDTQTSEKKKKKNSEEKKMKNRNKNKGKEKGKKRRPINTGGFNKVEDVVSQSPLSGNKAEDVLEKNNLIREPDRNDPSDRNANRLINSQFVLSRKDESSNAVTLDEPAIEKEVFVTAPIPVLNKKVTKSTETFTAVNKHIALVHTSGPDKTKNHRSRRRGGRVKNIKISSTLSPAEIALSIAPTVNVSLKTTDSITIISTPTPVTITPTAQLALQRFGSDTEKGPDIPNAIVLIQAKRHRSKDRAEREKRKRRRFRTAAPSVMAGHHHFPTASLNVFSSSVAPTTASPSVANIYGPITTGQTMAQASTSNVHKAKSQKSKGQGQRRRRGKLILPLSLPSPPYPKSSEDMVPVDFPLERNAAVTEPTEQIENYAEMGLLTSVPALYYASTKQHRPAGREQSTPRGKAMPSILTGRVTFANSSDPGHKPMKSPRITVATEYENSGEMTEQRYVPTKVLYITTTRVAPLSPIQLSIQRAHHQYDRKKRRKAGLWYNRKIFDAR